MTLNEYLLDNPQAVEGLFTKIFGKYMLRYYDHADYIVKFDNYAETSYQDSKNKKIVISMANVIAMLKHDINVLAVAYHELAHTLYTDDLERDKIRKKVIDHMWLTLKPYHSNTSVDPYYEVANQLHNGDTFHMIWNVLEDTRIERLLTKDFPFLQEIVEPLKTMIDPGDDDLFMWRSQKGKPSQKIVDLAEEFCSPKKKSQLAKAKIIYDIFEEIYLKKMLDAAKLPKDKQNSTKGSPQLDAYESTKDIKRQISNAQHTESLQERMQQHKKISDDVADQIEKLDEKYQATRNDSTLEHNAKVQSLQELNREKERLERKQEIANLEIEEYKKRIEELTGKEYSEITKKDAQDELNEVRLLETNNDHEKAVKSILENMKQTLVEQQDLQNYANSVVYYDTTKPTLHYPISKVYSPKQKLRNGMSAAMAKRYTLDLSNKVNVGRIVSSKANRTAPQVFYGRGKDISFTKKVVIFQDVSSSTHAFKHMFSSIAHSLANAFESVEWWGYGDYIFEKAKKDYDKDTRSLGDAHHLPINGTNASRLLNVMKKYKNKDYTYVIITDGDMNSIFKDIDTWNYFKDKIAVVGFIDQEIKNHAPHHVDLLSKLAKSLGYQPKDTDKIQDVIDKAHINFSTFHNAKNTMPLIVHGVNGVMELVKNRLR